MADLQRIFDSCKKAYEECYVTIAGMGDWLRERMDSGKKEKVNSKLLCKNFDIVLQFSLLQIAVADNELDPKEVIFIRDLTFDGDLFEYLNSFVESKAKVDWKTAYNCSVSVLKELLETVEPLVKSLSVDLVTVFAVCDASTVHNYVSDLKTFVMAIINGLGKMDGDFSYLEQHADCLIIRVISEIENRKEKLKIQFPEKFH